MTSKKIFVEEAKAILTENQISNRAQNLLVNGTQTSGNIFDIKNDAINEIQNIIRIEVEKYRTKFRESAEGLIKKMPVEYSLFGWLISMKSGGNLKPHIHTEGWLSGSIYINVPRKSKVDSGNLVVSLGDDKDTIDTRINEKKTINVITGSMVLFPASLMHHTIPFESEEERIVLAFDVKENVNSASPSQQQLNSLLEYYQNGRFNDAEKLAVSITNEFPKHQFGWKVLGAVLGQTGRKSEAVNANQTAVALSPQDAEAHNNLGNTLKELGRLEDAEASYNQAIALKPDFAEAHSNLGNTLKELGRLDEAETSCTRAIALKPDFAEAHNNLGNTLHELGRLEDAEASYNQAIALKPDYAEAHNNLGNTLHELGRLDEAEASYTQAIALKPDYAEAHNNLGSTLRELGRLDEAEASYNQAIALKPDLAEAHNNLGNTLHELGRLDEAETSCTRAIALKPDYAEAHYNLVSRSKN